MSTLLQQYHELKKYKRQNIHVGGNKVFYFAKYSSAVLYTSAIFMELVINMSRNRSISKVTGDQGSVPGEGSQLVLRRCDHTGSGAHPASPPFHWVSGAIAVAVKRWRVKMTIQPLPGL
jgi:hypothetical protein